MFLAQPIQGRRSQAVAPRGRAVSGDDGIRELWVSTLLQAVADSQSKGSTSRLYAEHDVLDARRWLASENETLHTALLAAALVPRPAQAGALGARFGPWSLLLAWQSDRASWGSVSGLAAILEGQAHARGDGTVSRR
jgi:hypothetical protein